MLRIDAHQHFWRFNPVRDSWINEDMAVIRCDFLPEHLQSILKQHDFEVVSLFNLTSRKKKNSFN